MPSVFWKGERWLSVFDYLGLNKITRCNSTAILQGNEMFSRTRQARVFSKKDFKTGFHQIRIHLEDIEKTASTTECGLLEYNTMAMRLCNASATFQTLMNSIARDVIDEWMVIYLDDLLIFSNSEEEYVKYMELVLELLGKTKYMFCRRNVFCSKMRYTSSGNWLERRGPKWNHKKSRPLRTGQKQKTLLS